MTGSHHATTTPTTSASATTPTTMVWGSLRRSAKAAHRALVGVALGTGGRVGILPGRIEHWSDVARRAIPSTDSTCVNANAAWLPRSKATVPDSNRSRALA